MDRRRSHRQAISLSALAHPAKGRSWLCGIRDFCQGGMLLHGADSTRSLFAVGAEPCRGDPLALHFSVPLAGGARHFRVQARIARVLDNGVGVGVVFDQGLPAAAFEALLAFSGAAAGTGAPGVAGSSGAVDGMVPAAAGASTNLSGAHAGAESTDSPGDVAAAAPDSAMATSQAAGGAVPAAGRTASPAESAPADTGAEARLAPVETLPPGDSELGIPLSLLRESRLTEAQAETVRGQIRGLVQDTLEGFGNQFVELASREFLASARDAGSSLVHQRYLDGLDLLERHGAEIVRGFVAGVLGQLDAVSPLEEVLERRRRRETGGNRELSVVDSEQFEDWLAVADLIAKTESRHADALLELRARFGLMARPWAHKDALPIGPAIIAWAFADALQDAAMRREIRHDAYRYFEQVLLRQLGRFYERLGAALEQTELFPASARLREALQRLPRPQPSRMVGGQATGSVNPLDWMSAVAMPGGGPVDVFGAPGRAPMARSVWGDPYLAARRLSGLGRHRAGAPGVGSMVQAGVVPSGYPPAGAVPDAVGSDAERVLSRTELLDALAVLERQIGGAPPADLRVKSRVLEILRQRHGDSSRIDPEELDNLEVVETLVDSLRTDRYLSDGARGWIHRLELTLNKLAARDRDFLDRDGRGENTHSAVTLLNQLARLGNIGDGRDGIERDLGRRVDELLERIVQEFDKNPNVIAAVVEELYPLVDKQERVRRANLERTVRASEGRQKLVRARRAVLEAMQTRLGGRDVPDLALQLLNPGWRNLLVHTHLRRGTDSAEWQEQLEVLDQIMGQLDDSVSAPAGGWIEPETVLKRVVQGLNSISFDPARRTPLVMALSAALVGDPAGEREPVQLTPVPSDGVVKALGFEPHEVLPVTSQPAEGATEEVRASWSAALGRARQLEVGEWLAATDADGHPQILSVAFVEDDCAGFVLVDRRGVKVRECTLPQMAEALFRGRITLLDDYDLPLMDRASQRMLESMHGRLAFQASHDDLTGLPNRREFERRVARAVTTAQTRGERHALIFIDLDQFKIINSTSGHAAGDQLLKHIGTCLSTKFGDARVHVARLGGDEFGVLAEDCAPERARELARQVLAAIRDSGFVWEGRAYSLAATLGLVLIDRGTASAEVALRFADEACYAAKDAGRNRIQEYRSADTLLTTRHDIMESVTHLDRALAENRLVLNCQAIAPVGPDRSRRPSYEILLTMLDESGRIVPSTEFIVAAETYQRMAAVDRWVIRRVLDWVAAHQHLLDDVGSFAINVSGQSMNDETFPDFVLQEFERTQAPTGKICFEITETAAIANLDNAREFMNRMKIIGCRFSLDDFGTGLSSYSYLRNLPVDFVKIDGVFVKSLIEDSDDCAVVRSINEISHFLGKETIAECVESPMILERIREIGIDYAQGFHIGKPMLLDEVLALTGRRGLQIAI